MELATTLLTQARTTDERRLLVLSGSRENSVALVKTLVDTVDVPLSETTYVGPDVGNDDGLLHCECLNHDDASRLLGTTRSLVVLNLHDRCEPNTLGKILGSVDGGGLFVLLTPPLAQWPEQRDTFDETLAVPPFEISEVTGHFRSRLVETLQQHRGIAIVDADTDGIVDDGLVSSPRETTRDAGSSELDSAIPETHTFPRMAYKHCLTGDQSGALEAMETLTDPDSGVVLEANRGRGKSSVAGLAAASLVIDGLAVLVTGPQYRSVEPLFQRAKELLGDLEIETSIDDEHRPQRVDAGGGVLRYLPPQAAQKVASDQDCVIVDEAAALPVETLAATLDAPRVVYATTTHGYEGTGRGFTVRFRDALEASSHDITEPNLSTPIRYAGGDPVEVWGFRALALDSRPPVDAVVSGATPNSVEYRALSSQQLLADESLLKEVFGLLVLAHYRTEPNDLARLLDAPNVTVHALFHDGHPVSVALLAREGDLRDEDRERIYTGTRIRGNLIPDVLTSQLRDEDAGTTVGYRVLRITTHSAVQSRGLGSVLLDKITEQVTGVDWLGVGYGATPRLVDFWHQNDFRPVHLSTTRNDRSGEHSVIMLEPLSERGERLCDRHVSWLLDRLPGTLPDALDSVDPDIVCAVCEAIPALPDCDLTDWEWRHAASVAAGPGIFETSPAPIRRLAFCGLVDDDVHLSRREQRLLVRRVLQLQSRERVADHLDFQSGATCMRQLGQTVRRLLGVYAPAWVRDECERFEEM